MAGGGAIGGINNMVLAGGASATASEGGWLSGLVPAANAGGSVGGEAGLLFSNGIHGILGANGAGWATANYGGFFIPSSSVAANVGGNFGFILDNGRATSSSSSSASAQT
ncbi:hypothetical protein LPJ57_001000 [Coemansia sp. RSA 486]|nr:hypothetical protein LPJ57_001000 [Coemansia sp. RSA 486]